MGKNCCKNVLGFILLCCFSTFMVFTFVGLAEIYTGCYIPEQYITPVYQTNSTIPVPGTGIKGFGSEPINLALKADRFPSDKEFCPRWNHFVSPITEIKVKRKRVDKNNEERNTYDHYIKTTRCTLLFKDEKSPEPDEFYSVGRHLQIVRNNPDDGVGVGQNDNCMEYNEALSLTKYGYGFIFSLIPISCVFVLISIMHDRESDKYFWTSIYAAIIGFPFAILYSIGKESLKITRKFVDYMTVYYNNIKSYIEGIVSGIWLQINSQTQTNIQTQTNTQTQSNPQDNQTGSELVHVAIVPDKGKVDQECAICFGEGGPENEIRALCTEYHMRNPDGSGHNCHDTYWHPECYATSLNHRSFCPNCRRPINRDNMPPDWLNVMV